jgi:hypothetical protein
MVGIRRMVRTIPRRSRFPNPAVLARTHRSAASEDRASFLQSGARESRRGECLRLGQRCAVVHHLHLAARRRGSRYARESGVLQATPGRRRDGGHHSRSWSDEVKLALREGGAIAMGSKTAGVGNPGRARLRLPGRESRRGRGVGSYWVNVVR